MRWTPGRRSTNLEDRRGRRVSGIGRMGLGGTVVLVILSLVFGQDFLGNAGGGVSREVSEGAVETTPAEERTVDFVSFVLDSTQATWARILPEHGARYRDAKLVLFRDAVESACGFAQSATGPFYCPLDETVYVDLSFFEELRSRFGAPGDFAQAYVLAHEIGHHVQNVLGVEQQVRAARQRDPSLANELSVRMELQADCFAGIWGNRSARQDLLEPGDVEEGLAAAAAVGDDRVSQGRLAHDAFTHGSAAQREAWFRRGLSEGRVEACDTFVR